MKTKMIAIVLFVAAGLIAAIISISSTVSVNNEYKRYISKATVNAEKDIPYIAATNYKKAFDIKAPSEETFLLYMEEMKKLGEDYYLVALEDYLVRFPMSSNAYELNLQRLFEEENYVDVVNLALEARSKEIATEKIKNYYMDAYYKYSYVRVGFDEANSFLGNYAVVKQGDLYGYINSGGDFLISPNYKDASIYFSGSAAIDDGTGYHMVNGLGFKVAIPSEPVDYMSALINGNILIKKGDKFGYIKSDMVVPETLSYDEASNFKNQVAAVCQNKKWALLGSDGKNITDFVFDDIIRDEYNTCYNNVIFAKTEGKYYMYNAEGKRINDTAFDDACLFVGAEPTAVKIGDKWGFVDIEGNIVIEPKYDDAKPFNCSLAPVCVDGVWDYIDSTETVRIEGDFEDAKSFASNGIAAIKEGEVWNYIKLAMY